CQRPARRCDLDHRVPYSKGGSTSSQNMGPLCERHHIGKHEAGWTPHRHDDGTTTWISPTKHSYQSRPPDLPHDTTSDPPPF
ncbi:MAG TPA: HNH endonuclease signature motif containing protein, partial [Jatrophihabitantaceae bacterium]